MATKTYCGSGYDVTINMYYDEWYDDNTGRTIRVYQDGSVKVVN